VGFELLKQQKVVKIISIFFFSLYASMSFGQCVELHGEIKEQTTEKVISANLFVLINGRKTTIGKSNELGEFTVQLPCDASFLLIEKKDYRGLSIPLNMNTEKNDFFCRFHLIPIDKPLADRPYSQSEQQELVLNNTKETGKKKATRTFNVIDAYTKEALSTKICLYYTKHEQKKCFDVAKNKQESIVFSEEDIIAFEVDKQGYQSYNGNFFLSHLNNDSAVYEISLLKLQTYIALSISNNKADIESLELYDKQNSKVNLSQKGLFFYGLTPPNNDYLAKVKTKTSKYEKKINISEGINFINLVADTPKEIEKVESNLPTNAVDEIIIYFEQSDFNLTKEAKIQLDNFSKQLKENSQLKVKIIGYTDNIGDPRLNEALSEYRAKISLNYLTKLGIDASRLSWVGMGDKNPTNPNDTELNKQKNRRVEIKIIK
jgi:outer membrane protein OmpA-like peptidoglycan-associated protein